MVETFEIERFTTKEHATDQYERQLQRLSSSNKEVASIERAVRDAVGNLREKNGRSFVIYGEPQSGKTEMMICLTAKLLDEGYSFILHLLNDSVDLLGQNLGRFKNSGLAPAARNFSEILNPEVRIKGLRHVVFCKKNGSDLRKLIDKIGKIKDIVIIDDEADYASPNSKINKGGKTPINDLITKLLGDTGIYIGVTATPARLDLNNSFDNDSGLWVNFPPHSKYTGQDKFFPIEGPIDYIRTLLPDQGSDPKYARAALFGFLVNTAYLNLYVHASNERNYSFLIHTSGKKADHATDWDTIHKTIEALKSRAGAQFEPYTKAIWELCQKRFADADPNRVTHYILNNIARSALVVLNSERDWKDNSGAATDPSSLFTIIIGGNIVSRGVTLNNLLAMFFTRDVKHAIQQDTYIQRARMFGSRGDYLRFFELTMPQALYVDWHRCFVFHRLALASITEGRGSLVWIGDNRISPVASNSIDRSTVDMDRGEMSFSLFTYSEEIEGLCASNLSATEIVDRLANLLGEEAFPLYLRRFIERRSLGAASALEVHRPTNISNYTDAPGELDKGRITRRRGFFGKSQLRQAKNPSAAHHLKVFHNGENARLFYKFAGSIQFIKNMNNDTRL